MPPPKRVQSAIDSITSPFAFQEIQNVQTTPGASRVIIEFTTRFPTVPVVEVSRVERIHHQVPNPVLATFPIFGGLRQTHRIEIPGLDPSTWHQFRIKAAGGPEGGAGLAKVFGDFYTASRSARVMFDSLKIFQHADNDMWFRVVLYDWATESRVGPVLRLPPSGRIHPGRGDLRQPFPSVTLGSRPDDLRIVLYGQNEDDDWEFGGGFHGFGSMYSETLSSNVEDGTTDADNQDYIVMETTRTETLPQFPTPVKQSRPFVLEALAKRFGFTLEGRIETTVMDHPETKRRKQLQKKIHVLPKYAKAMMPGQGATVGGKDGRAHAFAVGPDGSAYRKVDDDKTHRTSWHKIGERLSGPLTVLGSEQGNIDLFAVGDDGALRHARLDRQGDAEWTPQWRRLVDKAASEFVAIRSRDGAAHIFALAENGSVRHLEVPGLGSKRRKPPAWDGLGGQFRGAAIAVANSNGEFHVFLSDPDRGVFARRWSRGDANASERAWQPLPGFKGHLAAETFEDGSIAVGFANGDPSVYARFSSRKGWDKKGWIAIAKTTDTPSSQRKRPRAQGRKGSPESKAV
jgi:hypothetical protein